VREFQYRTTGYSAKTLQDREDWDFMFKILEGEKTP
jgi:hypothetical protein